MENTPTSAPTPDMTPKSGMGKLVLWAVGILAVAGIVGKTAMNKTADTTPSPAPSTDTAKESDQQAMMTPPAPEAAMSGDAMMDDHAMADDEEHGAMTAATYKDGTYTADGDYTSPAGAENIKVTLTIKGNVVTDADVKAEATVQKSQYMQAQFISGYKDSVIGKKLDEINVGKISGSSLTPIGFNNAVEKIKTQAKSS